MTRLWGLLLLIPVVLLCGCVRDTLNVGSNSGTGPDCRFFIDSVNITAENWNEGEIAAVKITWSTGTPPFKIAIDVGADEYLPLSTIEYFSSHPFLSYTWFFTLPEGAEQGKYYNYSVELQSAYASDTASGTYGPVGPPLNSAPEIVSAVYDEASDCLTVTVADAEGDDVDVSVTDITGLTLDSNIKTVTGGNGDAVFTWYADNRYYGGSGTTTVSVTDAYSDPEQAATRDVEITVAPMEISVGEGQLGIFPLETSLRVGDVLTVIVATGPFPADAPFAYMNGLAVTVNDGGDYVPGTFNVGQVGGETKDVDGIWAEMDPAPATFFVPEDFMMAATDVTADSTLDFMWFNVTPVHGGEVTTGGVLFNYGMEFDAAGTYYLGYLEFQDVKRTYYSDINGVEHEWGEPGAWWDEYSNITVNE